MGHIPYGYRIENGKAVLDEIATKQVTQLYKGYLAGLSLNDAAKEAGIDCYHATVSKILQNKCYLGDDFYPAIIEEDTFRKVGFEKHRRAKMLGRLQEPKAATKMDYAVKFKAKPLKQKYVNPFKQAEYAYSQIEREM